MARGPPNRVDTGHHAGTDSQSPFLLDRGKTKGPGQLRPWGGGSQGLRPALFTTVMEAFQYFNRQFSWTGAHQLSILIMLDPAWIYTSCWFQLLLLHPHHSDWALRKHRGLFCSDLGNLSA